MTCPQCLGAVGYEIGNCGHVVTDHYYFAVRMMTVKAGVDDDVENP